MSHRSARLLRVLSFAAIAILLPVFVQAAQKCDFEEELLKLYDEANRNRLKFAEQQTQILSQLEAIVSKCKNKEKAVREQLNQDDNAKFNTLLERRNIVELGSLVESRRVRDLQVLRRLAILAEKDVRWPEVPNEDHPDFIYYVILSIARERLYNLVDISTSESIMCSVESAINIIEQEAIDKISRMDDSHLKKFSALTDRLLVKYNVKVLDYEKLSIEDRQSVSGAAESAQPYIRMVNLLRDYEILKLLSKASEMVYQSDRNDIIIYGGDYDSVGKSINEKAIIANSYGESLKTAIAILRVIDKRIPSEDAKDIKKLADELGKKPK